MNSCQPQLAAFFPHSTATLPVGGHRHPFFQTPHLEELLREGAQRPSHFRHRDLAEHPSQMSTEGLRRSFNPWSTSECNSPNRRIALKDRQWAIRPNTLRLNSPSRECTRPRRWRESVIVLKQVRSKANSSSTNGCPSPMTHLPSSTFPPCHDFEKALVSNDVGRATDAVQ